MYVFVAYASWKVDIHYIYFQIFNSERFLLAYTVYMYKVKLLSVNFADFFLTKDKEIRWEQSMYTWKLR